MIHSEYTDIFSICAGLALAMHGLDMEGEDRVNSYVLGEYWHKLEELDERYKRL